MKFSLASLVLPVAICLAARYSCAQTPAPPKPAAPKVPSSGAKRQAVTKPPVAAPPVVPNYLGVYSGIVEVGAGAGAFELARVLQALPDGRAILVSSYTGKKPTLTADATTQYGSLLARVAEQQRVVHSGTWRINTGKLEVVLTTVGVGVSAEKIESRLVFERRADKLVTILTDETVYGREPLRLRRINVPLPGGDIALSVRVDGTTGGEGVVMANVGGQSVRVTEKGRRAWLAQNGAAVLYSASSGGGFENEGQTLYAYDVKTKKTRALLMAAKAIDLVREAKSAAGKLAYIALLSDTGVGAPMIAICDPERGEVFRRDNAKFAGMQAGQALVAVYKPGVFDGNAKPDPLTTITVDLDELLPAAPPAKP